MWRVRDAGALSTLAAGLALVAIGGATANVALAAFGLVIVISAGAFRTRANHNYWVTCRFHPTHATIVVEPTHPRFDDAARALFLRTLP